MAESDLPAVVQTRLTNRESVALRKHLESKEQPLSPTLVAELYELYLRGLSLEQIADRYRPTRILGAVVRAAEEDDWYGRRLEYRRSLLDTVRERVQQAQSESIVTTTHLVAMLNKRFGERVLRYLQTGEEEDLGDLKEWGLSQYKTVVELLLRLTGQDNAKKVQVHGKVEHKHETTDVPPAKPVGEGAPTSDDAAHVLALLSGTATLGDPQ